MKFNVPRKLIEGSRLNFPHRESEGSRPGMPYHEIEGTKKVHTPPPILLGGEALSLLR